MEQVLATLDEGEYRFEAFYDPDSYYSLEDDCFEDLEDRLAHSLKHSNGELSYYFVTRTKKCACCGSCVDEYSEDNSGFNSLSGIEASSPEEAISFFKNEF